MISGATSSYEWRHDGKKIGGEKDDTLRIKKVAAKDAGSYTVVVSNAGGSATSPAAMLTVTGGKEVACIHHTHTCGGCTLWADFVGANRDRVAFLPSVRAESGGVLKFFGVMHPG